MWERLGEERGIPATDIQKVRLFRYLDDITLITPPTVANRAFEILSTTLTEDCMLLHEGKCVAFTTDGVRPNDGITAKLWDNATDHGWRLHCVWLPFDVWESQ